jgi:type IV pilus assembly protein PilE
MGGFSLIDLMFAIVIVGILVTIALPSFMGTMRKSRRADGIQALRMLQLKQERWRASNPSYTGNLANLGISSATTEGGWYTLAVSSVTATGYTATATAVSGKSQVDDKANGISCATLTVNQDAPVFSPAGQTACWGQ